MDIYIMDISSGDCSKAQILTDDSIDQWDEHAPIFPDGSKIVWMSSMDIDQEVEQFKFKADLWIMNVDGSNKQRLTYFNDPGASEYIPGGVAVSDSSWNRDGNKLVVFLIDRSGKDEHSIVMIEFENGDKKPVCGNGICEPGETEDNCPEDCEKTFKVKSITTLKEKGGRVDWSHTLNLVAFDKTGSDNYYDVYTMNPDGSGEQCLTCGKSAVPQHHNGNPTWHSTGQWIAFQSVNTNLISDAVKKLYSEDEIRAHTNPGAGWLNNIWVMDKNRQHFYQMTDIGTDGGVLHPHFSHDGKKMLWAERIGKDDWVIHVADFTVQDSQPRLENITAYQPGQQHDFYETHGFSADGSKILFSGNLQKGQPMWGLDIYEMDLQTQKLTPLTNTTYAWDEHAHYSPDGSKILWMSSKDREVNQLKTDFWIMDVDGSNKQQLTFFNTPGHSHYRGESIVAADNSWSHDGKRIIAYIKTESKGLGSGGSIIMIEFENGDEKPVCGNGICEEGETIENCPEDCDDAVPLTITIISPQNRTYNTNSVNLNYSIDESTAWVGYSLDGAANVSIAGNTTLINLADGLHFICIYANDLAGNMNSSTVWFRVIASFDTGTGAYPSIFGVHNGTITPNQNIEVQKLYTYPCAGTGGHTEYAKIWNKTWAGAEAYWECYQEEWYNVTFNQSFKLVANETYNYTLKTGSYPQIIHEHEFNATGGGITCTEFIDANGERYYDWIPAFRLGR